MLTVVISPAKQMRCDADAFAPRGIPPFPRETARLVAALRERERAEGPEGLQRLWNVSDKLLAESRTALHAFEPISSSEALGDPRLARRCAPALFSYVGLQYRSMAPGVLDEAALAWLQDHLWILSGLYGCARPFDAVEPYRLEMGARLAVPPARNLYDFWGGRIARAVAGAGTGAGANASEGAGTGATVVNLASVEYAKAILPHLSRTTPVVTCIFGEEVRRGTPVQHATASKIARGSMVRWMAEEGITDAADLSGFSLGYRFAPALSEGDPSRGNATLVFLAEQRRGAPVKR